MSDPKRHHFVPKMLQSHFAVEGSLFVFDSKRAEKGVWRTSPGNLLVASHLYTETAYDGEKDSSMEKELSILEGNAAPVIEAIVEAARAGRAPKLTFHEKGFWDRFFIQQWRRVPEAFDSLMSPEEHASAVERILDQLQKDHGPVSNYIRSTLLSPEQLKRSRHNMRAGSLRNISPGMLGAIQNRGLAAVTVANKKKSFVLGSRPVIKLTPSETNDIADYRVEMWLAVRPDVMIGLGAHPGSEIIQELDDRMVRRTNVAVCSQSSLIAGRSPELLKSLAPYVGVRIDC